MNRITVILFIPGCCYEIQFKQVCYVLYFSIRTQCVDIICLKITEQGYDTT